MWERFSDGEAALAAAGWEVISQNFLSLARTRSQERIDVCGEREKMRLRAREAAGCKVISLSCVHTHRHMEKQRDRTTYRQTDKQDRQTDTEIDRQLRR